jgi:hypothetical protein
MIDIIIPIITSTLLILSEIMPFVNNIKSNGILELLIDTSKKILQRNTNNTVCDIESQPLLNGDDNDSNNLNDNTNDNDNDNDKFDSETINYNYKEEISKLQNQINDLQNLLSKSIESNVNIYENLIESRKMQSYEKYEMDYIKNFIRINYPEKQLEMRYLSETNKEVLRNLKYIIDYDSTTQVYVIRW